MMSPENKFIIGKHSSSGIHKVPLELYIHIPFCVKKCDYCDFLSFPAEGKIQEAYFDALCAEIRAWGGRLALLPGPDYVVTTVFIGGGTPSLPDARLIRRVMREIQENFSLTKEAEISMEANPGTLTLEKLLVYRSCRINRLSIGLQSADDRELALLGRIHTWEDFLQSYELARDAGFTNLNIDLISALPGQSLENWLTTLHRTARLTPEHISAYSLIVEEGTPFASRRLELPDEETEIKMYEETAKTLAEYGYEQYEISNYARPGFACRHNIGYWKRTEYLGLGLGASSFRYIGPAETDGNKAEQDGGYSGALSPEKGGYFRYANTGSLLEYLENSAAPEKIWKNMEQISRRAAMEEFLFLGLRMTAGISEEAFERTFGESISDRYGDFLKKYEASGHLKRYTAEQSDTFSWQSVSGPETYWRFTREGIHVSNRILADVLD